MCFDEILFIAFWLKFGLSEKHTKFGATEYRQILEEDFFFKFCVLLRKSKVYCFEFSIVKLHEHIKVQRF